MKPPLPAPHVPGNTPWEKLDNAVRTVFSVPKEALQKEQARLKKDREEKKQKRRNA
jgi:hypothetical protein